MSPKKGIHQFADAKIIELYSKALNSPISYPFLLIYKVNYWCHVFLQKKTFQ